VLFKILIFSASLRYVQVRGTLACSGGDVLGNTPRPPPPQRVSEYPVSDCRILSITLINLLRMDEKKKNYNTGILLLLIIVVVHVTPNKKFDY
jgi:hypothetical protein